MPAGAECMRSVLSCARCRRRKIKCDRLVPSCSKCKDAEASCTGFSSKGETEVPRSVVHFLEHEIATLEMQTAPKEVVHSRQGSSSRAPETTCEISRTIPALDHSQSQRSRGSSLAEAVITSDEMQSMINATMPSGNCLTDMLSNVRMGLTPSYTASSSTDANANTMRTTLNCCQDSEDFVNISILAALPSHVITTLVKKYIESILPVYPFVGESGIWHHTKRAIEKMSEQTEISPGCFVRPDYDFLVLYLILAVSSTLGSASSKHEARCMGFSRSLFAEGIHHLSSKAPFPNDLAEIQSTLLILQYALINPKYANVWILGGVVMRSCLELGLHREVPEPLGLDPSTIHTRRKIFWAAYCMDRSICSALQRPLSIPDSTIDTWCPSSGVRVLLGPKQGPALRQIQYSKLQSTIIEVHFQGKELGVGQTWEDWLAEMEHNLRSWYEALPPDEDKISTELSFLQGLTDLNRPSPRMPFPSQHSLLVAFKAACGSAHLYQQHITTGFFRCPWLVAHNTFASAMVALFCLRYGGEKICERWSAAEIFQMTKMFTMNLLSLSGQGWAEISKYAGTYERLLGPLLDAVFSNTSSLDKTFNPEQDAELARLIYPGPAHLEKLRFGNRTPWDEDFQVSDPAMFNWDDDVPIDISWGDNLAFDNLDPSGLGHISRNSLNSKTLDLDVPLSLEGD